MEPVQQPDQRQSLARSLLVPSIADWVFVSILCWLFFGAAGAASLLTDGDTGWHIRTGEHILATGQFPKQDLFSFTMEGKLWFAWEWLADVLLALVHGVAGLKGVVLLAGVVIAGTAAALLRYMIWLRINILVAVLAMLAASAASTVHWLARPHMFTWGFFLATIWLLEADRRRPSKRVYLMAPLVMLWTNVHGGFVAALVTIGIYLAGVSIEQLWAARKSDGGLRWALPQGFKRYGLLLVLCLAATVVNPYGYHLHQHIWGYLQSDFVLQYVQEFQSPDFRGESMAAYEIVLLLSLVACGRLLLRGEVTWALLVVAWAHASLVSVRHMPLFMIVAVPVIGREITLLLEEGARIGNSWLQGLCDLADDYGGRNRVRSESASFSMGWLSAAAVVLIAVMLQTRSGEQEWQAEFSELKFPALACDTLGDRLQQRRVLSMDQWGDYLIYRFYPRMKVFIDGRSDFYAPEIRDQYVGLLGSHWGWEGVLERYDFDAALIPVEWSLGAALKLHPGWRLIYDDGYALFFEKRR